MNDSEPTRDTVDLPDRIEFPRLFDFYELQSADHTRIHEFYDRLRDGSLSTTTCENCDALHFPPRVVCPECTSDDLTSTSLPHEGTLFAFSVVRGTAPIGMAEDVPFVVGIIDLEGADVRLSARLDGVTYDDLAIGDRVALKIVDIGDSLEEDRVFYRFEPV